MTGKPCPICSEWTWPDSKILTHHCKPRWEARIDDKWTTDGEYTSVYASFADDAAEKFAEGYDEKCDLGRGGELAVLVRKDSRSKAQRFLVTAEPRLDYNAHEDYDYEPDAEDADVDAGASR